MVRSIRSTDHEAQDAALDSLTPRAPRHQAIVANFESRTSVHESRSSIATLGSPGLDRIASIQRPMPWCVPLRGAQSFSAVRRWSSNNVGPVSMSHPESRSRCGSAPKAPSAKATSHRTNRQRMRSAPQALDSHPPRPTCRSARAPRLVPGCGRRPAGAARHPSTRDQSPVSPTSPASPSSSASSTTPPPASENSAESKSTPGC
jgi:hypothetical protein